MTLYWRCCQPKEKDREKLPASQLIELKLKLKVVPRRKPYRMSFVDQIAGTQTIEMSKNTQKEINEIDEQFIIECFMCRHTNHSQHMISIAIALADTLTAPDMLFNQSGNAFKCVQMHLCIRQPRDWATWHSCARAIKLHQ